MTLIVIFVILKSGIGCYVDRGSDIPLPTEEKLTLYLKTCKEISEERILPLLRRIHHQADAQRELPALTEACNKICCSYNQSIQTSEGEFRDVASTFHEIRKLSRIEDRMMRKNITLLHQIQQEYSRLRQHDFYETPQLRNLLSTYILSTGTSSDAPEVFRWLPSYPLRLFLSTHARIAKDATLLTFAELIHSDNFRKQLHSGLKSHEHLGWHSIPDEDDFAAVVELSQKSALDFLDIYMMDPQVGLTTIGSNQNFYSPNFPDYLITNGDIYSPVPMTPIRTLHRKFANSPPQTNIALEAVNIANLAGWSRKDALSHNRMLPFEACRNFLPEFFGGLRDNIVVLRLQQPCLSRFLVLFFDKNDACYAYTIEK